jgi:hypothetical protein
MPIDEWRDRRLRGLRLGGGELEPAADVDDGLPNPRRPVGEVQVGPPQTERLTAAETTGRDHLEQRAEPVRLGVPQEGRELTGGPRLDLAHAEQAAVDAIRARHRRALTEPRGLAAVA